MDDCLYHYTSIDNLEKILKTRSIRFTRLDFVDDLDEIEAEDLKNFGKFCYVSCWTSEEKESIPMWTMYAHEMQGIRIKMKKFPFRKYTFNPGAYGVKEKIETYINIGDRYNKELPSISSGYPTLIEIDYTEREELLYPHIKTQTQPSENKSVTLDNGKRITKTQNNYTISYSTKYIGEFKRKCWDFQKEWRYKIIVAPMTSQELENCKTVDDQKKLLGRLEDENYSLQEEYIDLKLDDKAISEMEILIGPRTADQQIDYLNHMAEYYGLNKEQINKSTIRIR